MTVSRTSVLGKCGAGMHTVAVTTEEKQDVVEARIVSYALTTRNTAWFGMFGNGRSTEERSCYWTNYSDDA